MNKLTAAATACAMSAVASCMPQTTANDGQLAAVSEPARLPGNLHQFSRASGQPILLFHMAGSNTRGEYSHIARRLSDEGFQVFGADLPGGGERFGETSLIGADGSLQDYCADYPAMTDAIEAVMLQTGKRPIVIGSSYSAALVMRAAVDHPDKVAGFVSFSPAPAAGLEICAPASLLAKLNVPGLGVRPRNELEHEIVLEQAREWAAHGVKTKIAEVRSHGASLMDPARSGEGAEAFWPALLHFLGGTTEQAESDG